MFFNSQLKLKDKAVEGRRVEVESGKQSRYRVQSTPLKLEDF